MYFYVFSISYRFLCIFPRVPVKGESDVKLDKYFYSIYKKIVFIVFTFILHYVFIKVFLTKNNQQKLLRILAFWNIFHFWLVLSRAQLQFSQLVPLGKPRAGFTWRKVRVLRRFNQGRTHFSFWMRNKHWIGEYDSIQIWYSILANTACYCCFRYFDRKHWI